MVAHVLGSAQSMFHELSDLRFDIEQRDLRWQRRRIETVAALTEVQATIEQNRSVTAPGDAGEEPVTIDVDYWSRGALGRLVEEVRAQLAAVQDEQSPLSESEFNTIMDQVAPQYVDRVEKIVTQASTAAFASQLRASFADLIVGVLEESHYYRFEDSTYAGQDAREAFYARSRHGSGSEIVVQVEPVDEQSPQCSAQILSYDVDAENAQTRDSRKASIQASLASSGFGVAEILEDEGDPDQRYRDLEALRHESVPGRLQQAVHGAHQPFGAGG
jgi:hypothetical protein